MADYVKALNEGFAAAKKADTARKEIKQVLEEFRKDIFAGSKGKLLIELKDWEEELDPLAHLMRGAVAGSSASKTTYTALTASNPMAHKKSYRQLARWKQSKDGYPCSLVYSKQERQFEDRVALERGLADLLKDPSVGETLYFLINAK
jgi:hypothetical protein